VRVATHALARPVMIVDVARQNWVVSRNTTLQARVGLQAPAAAEGAVGQGERGGLGPLPFVLSGGCHPLPLGRRCAFLCLFPPLLAAPDTASPQIRAFAIDSAPKMIMCTHLSVLAESGGGQGAPDPQQDSVCGQL
jgi:hypothetical protein